MCMWETTTRSKFEELVATLTEQHIPFDALAVRNQLRAKVGRSVDISYGDVFSELWHYYRKGQFTQPYIVHTKVVSGGLERTVEYVPASETVLKKVRQNWANADLRAGTTATRE
jgi:hypothetical protein